MTQGRKPLAVDITDVIDPTLDQDKINGAMAAMRSEANDLALLTSQHDSAVRAVALQIGYQLPADCTDPDLIQRDISMNMRRSVEACLEVGKGLRVLKEACQHGGFTARLDVLGIDPHVASRFVSSAVKFSKLRSNANLINAIGNQTKLFEMICLDGDQLEELELTGQTGELYLDDVATMSVKELRHALREAKQEAKAKDQVLADKNATMDKLRAQVKRVQSAAPDEVLADLKKEATLIAADAEGAILGSLRQALLAINSHGDEPGRHNVYLAGLIGQVQAQLNAIRLEFNLPDVSNAADQQLVAEMAEWDKE